MSVARKIPLRSACNETDRLLIESRTNRAVSCGLRAFRESWPAIAGKEKLAPFLGLAPRQLLALIYKQAGINPRNKPLEWHEHVQWGLVAALEWYAAYLRTRADHWERVAADERRNLRQFWDGERCPQHGANGSAR